MSRRRQTRRADHIYDDGVDPRTIRDHGPPNAKQAGRKARQLSGQVKDALYAALGGCGDPVLQALAVVDVAPAPHSGRLRVTVALPSDVDEPTAIAALGRAAGKLRCDVAAAVNRRYAPELVFEVT